MSGNLLWINSVWKWKLDDGNFDLQKKWVKFMFGCFGFILAHLGFFLGWHCRMWGSCWAVGVIMVFWWCLRHVVWALRLRSVSGFVVLWVVGVLCLGSAGRDIGGMSVVIWWRLGGVSVMSWCNPAVYPRLSRTFGGVCAVSCLWVSCWCWHGVFWLWVGGMWTLIWVDIRYFNGVLHLRARTRYTISILHACGP